MSVGASAEILLQRWKKAYTVKLLILHFIHTLISVWTYVEQKAVGGIKKKAVMKDM